MDKALAALKYIIPILEKYNFRWVITGGFACYVYGVDRPITDIDVDISTSKDSSEFNKFIEKVRPYQTQALEHFVDQNYGNYNMELTYEGQVLDICPMAEMNVFDQAQGKYVNFYEEGLPDIELVKFCDIELPLLSKELIIKNKEMLVWKRDSDLKDIEGLKKLQAKVL